MAEARQGERGQEGARLPLPSTVIRCKDGDVGLGAAPGAGGGGCREGSAFPGPLERQLQTHKEKGNRNLRKDTERRRLRAGGRPWRRRRLGCPRAPCKRPSAPPGA